MDQRDHYNESEGRGYIRYTLVSLVRDSECPSLDTS